MKTRLSFVSLLTLATSLHTAQAQTPVSTPGNPTRTKATKTADHRAATYQGPKVTKDSKALGRKMVQKSKPTDMLVPVPAVKK